ncbi:MAG: hypothetical protein K2J51_03065 [Alistipes sp.]|nr:hypothetical protein [Alistipes sp.]
MKITGRNITRRLYGLSHLPGRIARARYFRGHGVHSPFVYALVRQVFMRRALIDGDRRLYEAMLAAGASERRAVQIQNLAIHCGYDDFGMDCAEGDIYVASAASDEKTIRELARRAAETGATLCIMQPYDGRERQTACRELVDAHVSTSVDNRGYLLLFNNYLPKQHFRI